MFIIIYYYYYCHKPTNRHFTAIIQVNSVVYTVSVPSLNYGKNAAKKLNRWLNTVLTDTVFSKHGYGKKFNQLIVK